MKKSSKWQDISGLIADSFRMSRANYVVLTFSAVVESARSIFQMMIPAMLIDKITGADAFGSVMNAVFFYALIVLLADASKKALSLFTLLRRTSPF